MKAKSKGLQKHAADIQGKQLLRQEQDKAPDLTLNPLLILIFCSFGKKTLKLPTFWISKGRQTLRVPYGP